MKITKKLYNKMLRCYQLTSEADELRKEIELALETMGIDIDKMREEDQLVDMLDYGNGVLAKSHVESILDRFRSFSKR